MKPAAIVLTVFAATAAAAPSGAVPETRQATTTSTSTTSSPLSQLLSKLLGIKYCFSSIMKCPPANQLGEEFRILRDETGSDMELASMELW